MFNIIRILTASLILVLQTTILFADRIKDLTSLAGIRSNQLVGYGVVVGVVRMKENIFSSGSFWETEIISKNQYCKDVEHLVFGRV